MADQLASLSPEALVAVWFAVGALFVAGLVGALVPVMPGTPLVVLGALVYAAVTRFTIIGPGRLLILAAIAALGWGLEHVAGALGAKRSGGSAWAVGGALVGAMVGFVFFPVGVLIGPIVGAVAGEMLRGATLETGLRSGVGALVGIVIGAVVHFTLALVMVALFAWWVWRG